MIVCLTGSALILSQDDEVDEMMKAAQSCEMSPGVIDYRRFTKVLMQG